MKLWTLVIYDIKTNDNDSEDLDEFREFITKECNFEKLQNSAYYREGSNYGDLLDKIKSLPPGSKVNITVLDDKQFRQLLTNQVTGFID